MWRLPLFVRAIAPMIGWLYRWLIPDEAVRAIGYVRWRKVDPGQELVASGGLCAPLAPLYPESRMPWDWRPWPMLVDLFPLTAVRRSNDPWYQWRP